MESFDDIDSHWDYWKSFFVQIVDSHIPTTKARVRAKTLPWIDSDVRRLIKARTYYRTKAKKSMKVEDWEQYRKLRNQVTWRLKKAKLEYFGSLSQQSSRNPRKVWKEMNCSTRSLLFMHSSMDSNFHSCTAFFPEIPLSHI